MTVTSKSFHRMDQCDRLQKGITAHYEPDRGDKPAPIKTHRYFKVKSIVVCVEITAVVQNISAQPGTPCTVPNCHPSTLYTTVTKSMVNYWVNYRVTKLDVQIQTNDEDPRPNLHKTFALILLHISCRTNLSSNVTLKSSFKQV